MSKIICSTNLCSGCGACLAVCPKQCISLKPDSRGHLFPLIDKKACVHCNLCRNTCPVNNPLSFNTPKTCYAGWAKDENEYISSSSGGAAAVFSKYILEQGGTVYGAALQDNTVRHIRVSDKTDLSLLKGSKYVYSYAADVYQLIKKDLGEDKKVLFIGTSCQNAAVYNLFGNNPNLFLVNLICHGVPALKMLKEHLKEKGQGSIKNISFRYGSKFRLKFPNYNSSKNLIPDTYMTLFLKAVTYRPSCYKCQYAKAERIGDITIGDFWGLGKNKEFKADLSKGCSVITVNTGKGVALLNACSPYLELHERAYTEAVNGNAQLHSPVADNIYLILFNKFYPRCSFGLAAWLSSFPLLIKELLKNIINLYMPHCFKEKIFNIYKHFKGK